MPEITLEQMLDAREKRAEIQKKLLDTYGCPVVSFTMNIAGPVKISPLIERAFHEGLKALKRSIPKEHILSRYTDISDTGCEAMFAVDTDSNALKEICIKIEEETPLGRLFDMDVIDKDIAKLTRKSERGCIVCGKPGRGCAARRAHSVMQLQSVTHEIMRGYFESADTERVACMAVESLLEEAYTTPKPGLVDNRNSGSHKDMDINTFSKSANALKGYFEKCFSIGRRTAGGPQCETFAALREAGLAAEKTMYDATGGINTHKGAIYSMGILCGALGRLWMPGVPFAKSHEILSESALIAKDAVKEDFKSACGSTTGEKLYLEKGLRGIRGEVADGFPSVEKFGLPFYREALKRGLSTNDAGAAALISLIANVEDTNLYNRGGSEGAAYAAQSAKKLINTSPYPSVKQLEELDDDFISRNLSPGGSADLLAVTYFLYKLQS